MYSQVIWSRRVPSTWSVRSGNAEPAMCQFTKQQPLEKHALVQTRFLREVENFLVEARRSGAGLGDMAGRNPPQTCRNELRQDYEVAGTDGPACWKRDKQMQAEASVVADTPKAAKDGGPATPGRCMYQTPTENSLKAAAVIVGATHFPAPLWPVRRRLPPRSRLKVRSVTSLTPFGVIMSTPSNAMRSP